MKTFEEWKDIANKIHDNVYEYTDIKKINKVYCFEIVCKTHGVFYKKIQNHIIKNKVVRYAQNLQKNYLLTSQIKYIIINMIIH